MNVETKVKPVEGLALLRQPFPVHQISKLPKETKAQIDERKNNRNSAINCSVCGGWHHKNAIHLDYVGHAALTDRLLDTDIEWTWEPVAFNADGLPALDRNGGLWIKLTVCGVTRLGYGAADGKSGGDAVKEIIGDALRNAAMRFGAALDLWHKGDLHLDEDDGGNGADKTAAVTDEQREQIIALAHGAGKTVQQLCDAYRVDTLKQLTFPQAEKLIERLKADAKPKGSTETKEKEKTDA